MSTAVDVYVTQDNTYWQKFIDMIFHLLTSKKNTIKKYFIM